MKALQEKILREGRLIGTEIVKVDSFLNHRIDTRFADEMGEEIARLFAAERPNKILTVEASGIAIACSAARAFGYLPVVFAKKSRPSTMVDGSYAAEARSFTKGTVSVLVVAKDFLSPSDRVLIVDDFLATGEAGLAMCSLAEQAGATVCGFCAAISKNYQGGAARIAQKGIRVESLADIARIENGQIIFTE